jgi:hypothetical protein
MANVLNTDKQIAVISALAEGSSIRSIERITGVYRDTIMRLGVKVGKGCAALMDAKMRDLPCRHLEFGEIWGFIGKKEKHVTVDNSLELGDVWKFCAVSQWKIWTLFFIRKATSCTKAFAVAQSRLPHRNGLTKRNRQTSSCDCASHPTRYIAGNGGTRSHHSGVQKQCLKLNE